MLNKHQNITEVEIVVKLYLQHIMYIQLKLHCEVISPKNKIIC